MERFMAWSAASASLVVFVGVVFAIAATFLAQRTLAGWAERRRLP
jgi:hypothetical protein